MGMLIAVVGNTGVGKTTLVKALQSASGFAVGLEQHAQRPFQMLFKLDPRHALANQIDYLLLRAEQESELRAAPGTGLIDGGLDQDFHGFTRLFHECSYLDDEQFELCARLYAQLRSRLPLPELIVYLTADGPTLQARLAGRDRVNITGIDDIPRLGALLDAWVSTLEPERVLRLDVTHEPVEFPASVERVLARLVA